MWCVENVPVTEFDFGQCEKPIMLREKGKIDPLAPLLRTLDTRFYMDELSENDLKLFYDIADKEVIMST